MEFCYTESPYISTKVSDKEIMSKYLDDIKEYSNEELDNVINTSNPDLRTVLAIIALGLSISNGIAFKVSNISVVSFPFIELTLKPNDCNFSSNGSIGFTFSVLPVICNPFLSIIIIRLSSLYLFADVKASHTEPSDNSPSPKMV